MHLPVFDPQLLSDEARAEIRFLPALALNLNEGMTVIRPINVSRAWTAFMEEKEPSLSFLALDRTTDTFLDYLFNTRKKQRDLWENPAVWNDLRLYIARQTWEQKVERGTCESPHAFVVAHTLHKVKEMRGFLHESVGHALKHNQLPGELRDELDALLQNHIQQYFAPINQMIEPAMRLALEDQTNA